MIKRILGYIKGLFSPKIKPVELTEYELQVLSDKRELETWISNLDRYRNNLNASLDYELRNFIGKTSNDLLIKQLRYNIREAEGIIYQLKNKEVINRTLLPKEQFDKELNFVKPKKQNQVDGSLFVKPYTPSDILRPTNLIVRDKPSTIRNMLYFKK